MLTSLLQGKQRKTVPTLKLIYFTAPDLAPILSWEIHYGPNWYLVHHNFGGEATLLATLLKTFAPHLLEVQESSPEISNKKPD